MVHAYVEYIYTHTLCTYVHIQSILQFYKFLVTSPKRDRNLQRLLVKSYLGIAKIKCYHIYLIIITSTIKI